MRRLFIIRKDLNLSAGKLAAMTGHCCEAFWTNLLKAAWKQAEEDGLAETFDDGIRMPVEIPRNIWEDYVNSIFTKTLCEAKNLAQLRKVEQYIEEVNAQLPAHCKLVQNVDFGYINDKCLTELKPENSDGTTTVGIWFRPMSDGIAHMLSKKYKLYGAFDKPKLSCWKVTCNDAQGNAYEVGVMAVGADAAMKSAEKSLLEGQHLACTAVAVAVAKGI